MQLATAASLSFDVLLWRVRCQWILLWNHWLGGDDSFPMKCGRKHIAVGALGTCSDFAIVFGMSLFELNFCSALESSSRFASDAM